MTKKRTRMLSAEEEIQLLNDYLDNNDIRARNKLVTSYMPLATAAAEKFARGGTAPLEDLVQDASIALMQTIDNFDRSKGVRVGTLAQFYIKAALMRHVMDFSGPTRVGTNRPDKTVYTNLRKHVSEIQSRNGGAPITDADREEIASRLRVSIDAVKRMETRVFASDVTVAHTDSTGEDEEGRLITRDNVIAVAGEQGEVDRQMDTGGIMSRIRLIAEERFSDRDLEIVLARLGGDMSQEGYAVLTNRYNITVERVRQIQRAGLASIHEALVAQGVRCLDDIAI